MPTPTVGTEPVTSTAPIITIVGGTGFLGKYIAQLLAREGYRLKIISRNPSVSKSVSTIGDLGQAVLIKGNLSKPETITKHIPGSYAVISMVGILHQRGKQNFNMLHTQGAAALAQAAAQAGVKQFIQISALGVDKATDSQYAQSKLAGEQAIKSAFPQATILRPSVIFGPEDSFYNQFAGMRSLLPFLPLFNGGTTKFQLVYVQDVANAVLACLHHKEHTQGNIYELGGPLTYSFKEILSYISQTIGKKPRFVPVPSFASNIMARFMEFLPSPPLTRDQLRLLKYDNVVSPTALGFKDLGISPTAVEVIVPTYLSRFYKYRSSAPAHA